MDNSRAYLCPEDVIEGVELLALELPLVVPDAAELGEGVWVGRLGRRLREGVVVDDGAKVRQWVGRADEVARPRGGVESTGVHVWMVAVGERGGSVASEGRLVPRAFYWRPLSASLHRRRSMALPPQRPVSAAVCATREDAQNNILFTTARISDALENFRYRSAHPDPEQAPYRAGLRSELVRHFLSFRSSSRSLSIYLILLSKGVMSRRSQTMGALHDLPSSLA